MVNRIRNLVIRTAGFVSCFSHLLVLWPRIRHLALLRLCFLFYFRNDYAFQDCCRIKLSNM